MIINIKPDVIQFENEGEMFMTNQSVTYDKTNDDKNNSPEIKSSEAPINTKYKSRRRHSTNQNEPRLNIIQSLNENIKNLKSKDERDKISFKNKQLFNIYDSSQSILEEADAKAKPQIRKMMKAKSYAKNLSRFLSD